MAGCGNGTGVRGHEREHRQTVATMTDAFTAGKLAGINDIADMVRANPTTGELDAAHTRFEKKTGRPRKSMTMAEQVRHLKRVRGG